MVLVAIIGIIAIAAFTDYLDLGIKDAFSGIDWSGYFVNITTAVIIGVCFLAAVAIMSATYYFRA